jgi:outer membrane protein OmpA-like peptidoglycan-associated protein
MNRARRAAAILAGLGLSPFSLAAAAVIHVGFWLAIGPWVLTQASAARSIHVPIRATIVATRVVYVSPGRSTPARVAVSPKPLTQIRADTATVATTSGVATVERPRPDSAGSRPKQDGFSAERAMEIDNALRQELFFGDGNFELRREDRPKLEVIVRVLVQWPVLRLRVLGAAPRAREPGSPLPGMAEAEAIKRVLVQGGIAPERIEIGQMPEAERYCPEREPNCAAARRRVRTMAAIPASQR